MGLEFVKHFRAHLAPIKNMTINSNGTLMISISEDKHGKVFDVVNFDMINILAFDFTPEVAAWIHQPGDAIQVQFFFFHKPMISKRLGCSQIVTFLLHFVGVTIL